MQMVYHPLEQISANISSLQQALIGMEMACGLLDEQPDIRTKRTQWISLMLPGGVTFERCASATRGRPDTLKDISFEARRGQVIAIVGPTKPADHTGKPDPAFYGVASGGIFIGRHRH